MIDPIIKDMMDRRIAKAMAIHLKEFHGIESYRICRHREWDRIVILKEEHGNNSIITTFSIKKDYTVKSSQLETIKYPYTLQCGNCSKSIEINSHPEFLFKAKRWNTNSKKYRNLCPICISEFDQLIDDINDYTNPND